MIELVLYVFQSQPNRKDTRRSPKWIISTLWAAGEGSSLPSVRRGPKLQFQLAPGEREFAEDASDAEAMSNRDFTKPKDERRRGVEGKNRAGEGPFGVRKGGGGTGMGWGEGVKA